ncbi:MAG: hypothetical protein ACTSRQ_18060, partial [Candidatus Thorarchaeota archaeon]
LSYDRPLERISKVHLTLWEIGTDIRDQLGIILSLYSRRPDCIFLSKVRGLVSFLSVAVQLKWTGAYV